MDNATTVVIDTSVAAKWYLPEKHHEDARRLRDHFLEGTVDLTAPSVFPYEVINALRYSGQFGECELEQAAGTLPSYGIDLVPFHRLEGLVSVAFAIENTIYDASYIALAAAQDAVVYTADRKLIDGLTETEYEEYAEHVRSVPSA
ncbi:MAG: type II toxin-antitoxin system VapC family toxin [Halalkalicoccus sp.]